MHSIAEMEIRNYRSCKNTQIKPEPFAPLVGYNNAGNSNLGCFDSWEKTNNAFIFNAF